MHRLASECLLEEHFCLRADVPGIELLRLLVAQLEQALGAQFLVLVAHHIGNAQCSRARSLGIGEHVQLGDRQTLQELIALLEALGRLSPAPHHHVHADEGIGHLLLDEHHLVGEERLVVAAVHQLQHLIAATLQRDVEVGHEGTAPGTISYQFIIAEIRLQTRDAVTPNALHLVQSLHQVEEILVGGLSEVADVHAGEHYFLATLSCSLLRLLHEGGDGGIARVAAGEGNRAIGAIIVAAVLHLQEVARAVATRA